MRQHPPLAPVAGVEAGRHPSAERGVVVRCARSASAGPARRALLLHGLASSSAVWAPLLARADRRLELWTADMPWSAEAAGCWMTAEEGHRSVAQAIGMVGRPVDVVLAHSFAAIAVLEWIDQGVGPGPKAVVLVSPFYRPTADSFDWPAISYYLNDFLRMLEEGVRVHSGGRLSAEVQREMASHLRDRVGPYGWVRFFAAYLRTPALRPARLRRPFLVVGGAQDFAASPTDSRALAAALPHCQLAVLPECGHFPMVEQPDRFAATVNRFLEAVGGRWAEGGGQARERLGGRW